MSIAIHYICVWHANSSYLSKFHVNVVTNIEVIRQNVFSHARVMVIGVGRDIKSNSTWSLTSLLWSFNWLGNKIISNDFGFTPRTSRLVAMKLHLLELGTEARYSSFNL